MAHRKEEFDANGHEVVIQQVRGPDSSAGESDPKAWIDGKAAHALDAMYYAPVVEYPEDTWEAIERIVSFMVSNDVYFCPKCNTFYDYTDSATTGFAGHKCGDCAREAEHCPDNPDGDSHDDECLNPRQRRNARVATKYRCVHCGRNRSTTPTG